jgi:hypothetical protein
MRGDAAEKQHGEGRGGEAGSREQGRRESVSGLFSFL